MAGAAGGGAGGGEALPPLRADYGMDVRKLAVAIEGSLVPVEGLDLRSWLAAFWEVVKLFHELGGMWGFMERDVRSKVETVERVLAGLGPQEAVNASVLLTGARAQEPDEPTKAFILLHRSEEFLIRAIWDVFNADAGAPLGPVARQAYDATLGRFHNALVRRLVHGAMGVLGRREDLARPLLGPLTEAQARPFLIRVHQSAPLCQDRLRPYFQRSPVLQRLLEN